MAYSILQDHFRKIRQIGDAMGILGWDQATMMPSGGAEGRTEQMTVLGGILHGMKTDPRIGDWLAASADEDLDDWSQANLREISRIHLHETALTSELVEALTRATMKCEFAWRTARPANDFAAVKPLLEDVLRLTREKAAMVGEKLNKAPYDALIDEYEPGATSAELDVIFDEDGWVDAFRALNQKEGEYTWWSNRGRARENNVGWRIDYQVISADLCPDIQAVDIHTDDNFSDHAPLVVEYR